MICGAVFAALMGLPGNAQTPGCPVVTAHSATPAETAFVRGDYKEAEALYTNVLVERPEDERAGAGLVRTLLREGKTVAVTSLGNSLVAAYPASAVLLAALAEVELRQGEPWLAKKTLDRATAIDPCVALTHLIRSKVDRVDSMYSSERSELQAAYAIDPSDEEIARVWRQVVSVANDAVSIDRSMPTTDLDATARLRAQVTLKSMLLGLSENSQTCQVVPVAPSAVLPLLPSVRDGKHIDGYKVEVKLPQTKAILRVHTATSGMYISRALADLNGLHQAADGVPGTVYAADVTIGSLAFHECTLGVSETPFFEKADGYIGTDVFSSYLMKLDFPNQTLELSPLPPVLSTVLPGDRTQAAELRGFSPVYHRRQYLLVPVMVNGKERKLFVLDTGFSYTTMSSNLAHSVSTMRMNFTNPDKTTSGQAVDVYRDSFYFEFLGLLSRDRGHVVEMESPEIEANVGMKVGGMLGFDMLRSMTMQLDYRDGLIKLDAADPAMEEANGEGRKGGLRARTRDAEECPADDMTEMPFVTLITAKPTGLWDSGSLKAGEWLTAKVTKEWIAPACRLDEGANLYGHVVSVAHSKHHGHSELALIFDEGDCTGYGRRALTLNVVGMLAPEDNRKALHDALPIQVNSGVRNIKDAIGALSMGTDFNLNPEMIPVTVHPGMVTRMPGVELGLHGGPHCSVLLRRSTLDVRVGPKTQLLLTMGNLK